MLRVPQPRLGSAVPQWVGRLPGRGGRVGLSRGSWPPLRLTKRRGPGLGGFGCVSQLSRRQDLRAAIPGGLTLGGGVSESASGLLWGWSQPCHPVGLPSTAELVLAFGPGQHLWVTMTTARSQVGTHIQTGRQAQRSPDRTPRRQSSFPWDRRTLSTCRVLGGSV